MEGRGLESLHLTPRDLRQVTSPRKAPLFPCRKGRPHSHIPGGRGQVRVPWVALHVAHSKCSINTACAGGLGEGRAGTHSSPVFSGLENPLDRFQVQDTDSPRIQCNHPLLLKVALITH